MNSLKVELWKTFKTNASLTTLIGGVVATVCKPLESEEVMEPLGSYQEEDDIKASDETLTGSARKQ